MKRLFLLIFAASFCFAGRQVDASTQYITNSSVTQLGPDDPFTIEFQAFFDGDTNTSAFYQGASGTSHRFFHFATADTRLEMTWYGGSTPSQIECQSPNLMSLATKVVYGRFSVNPATNESYCEVYDILGAIFYSSGITTYASHGDATANGFDAPGAGSGTLKYGFYRLLNVYIPIGSGVPYTSYNSNMVFHWPFDSFNNTGTLADAAPGNLWPASMVSGSPTYTAQEGQTVVTSIPRTGDAPTWAPWRTQRVGVAGQTLNGCTSITQADSGTLTYQWTQTVGATVAIDDDTACETEVDPYPSHGSYAMELVVTDTDMNVGTTVLYYGAVTMDANGVVTPRNADVPKFFGPMIAFGYSPWEYMDIQAYYMVQQQPAEAMRFELNDPPWLSYGDGTATYLFGANGWAMDTPGGVLDGDITDSATSMVIDNADNVPCLADVIATSTPCVIYFGTNYQDKNNESARICTASASTGNNVTVGFCYDGRGTPYAIWNGEKSAARSAHTNGTVISSRQVVGTSTQFISDSETPWCPAGIGPPGAIKYSTGTVTLTASSSDIVGTGTTWNLTTIGPLYNYIRIEATHGGGTPFIATGIIVAIDDTTHIDIARPLPADVDSGPFNYQILSERFGVAEFQAYGGNVNGYFPVTSCESETRAYSMIPRDIGELQSTVMTGRVTYLDGFAGISGDFGPDFYSTAMGAAAFFERSGYGPAKSLAIEIANGVETHPEVAGGWYNATWFTGGGPMVSALMALSLYPDDTTLEWPIVRKWGQMASALSDEPCTQTDAREVAYRIMALSYLEQFDTDMTYNPTWNSELEALMEHMTECGEESDYSYAVYYKRDGAPNVGLTMGDTAVMGTGLTSDRCFGNAQQTVTMTNGSTEIVATSGTFAMGTFYLVVDGTFLTVYYVDSTHLGIPVPWQGSTGSYSSMSRIATANSTNEMTAFGDGIVAMSQNYMCIFNSSTSLTLDRPWHTTTGTYAMYTNNLVGYGTQGYMMGMLLSAMKSATYSSDSTIADGFAALVGPTAEYFRNNAYDSVSRGMYYGIKFNACSGSSLTGPPVDSYDYWLLLQCRFGTSTNQKSASRALTGETMAALVAYSATSNPDAFSWANDAYGATYGQSDCAVAVASTCDDLPINELNDNAMRFHKWPGFFFGMGMAHQWPATYFMLNGESGTRIRGVVRIRGNTRF